MKMIFILLTCLGIVFFCGCESYSQLDEMDGIMGVNDPGIVLKANTDAKHHFTITKTDDEDGTYFKIEVQDEFSLRGKAGIEAGKPYKLSFTIKNESADPVVNYSFWTDAITTTRHFTLAGKNGNPPVSKTQAVTDGWTTFEETFEGEGNEKDFMLTLNSGKGVFYVRDLSIEDLGS